jgi:hypothetical protein
VCEAAESAEWDTVEAALKEAGKRCQSSCRHSRTNQAEGGSSAKTGELPLLKKIAIHRNFDGMDGIDGILM